MPHRNYVNPVYEARKQALQGWFTVLQPMLALVTATDHALRVARQSGFLKDLLRTAGKETKCLYELPWQICEHADKNSAPAINHYGNQFGRFSTCQRCGSRWSRQMDDQGRDWYTALAPFAAPGEPPIDRVKRVGAPNGASLPRYDPLASSRSSSRPRFLLGPKTFASMVANKPILYRCG